jgi:cytoskeletal protein CcmA (bactofilin family)
MWTPNESAASQQPPHIEQQGPAAGQTAYIGKSLLIKGEVTGSEPLHIDGRVEGSISLPGGHVSVGREGVVASNVHAGEIIVRGRLQGNVKASGRIEVHRGGSLIGQVVTQRISIEDGAEMQGSIEMVRPDPKAHLEAGHGHGTRADAEHGASAEQYIPATLNRN